MNVTDIIEKVTGDLGDKRRWRAYKARVKELPAPYRTATGGIERYLMYYGAITRGDVLMTMLEALLDLVEQSAAAGTPVRAVVGDDPVEFAEDFVRTYGDAQWISKERARLVEAIDRAEAEEQR